MVSEKSHPKKVLILKLPLLSICWLLNEALGKNAVTLPNTNPLTVSLTALNPEGDSLGDKAPSST